MPEAPHDKPHLEVVAEEPPAPAADPEGSGSRGPGRLAVLLGVLLVLVALALVLQTRRAGELSSRVAGLEGELGAARQELSAYRGQLGRVRILVDGLDARLDELRELVGRDPVPPEPQAEPEAQTEPAQPL